MVSFSDNSPLRQRSRYELKRRYFHRGHLWPWILVVLIPAVVRLVTFYEATYFFQSSPSTTEDVKPELQLYEFPESTPDGGETPIIQDSPIFRPDEVSRANDDKIFYDTDDRMKRDTENEKSSGRHLPVAKRPHDEHNVGVNLGFPDENVEDNIEGDVDEVQLRQIGERIEAIKRWENWEERSRWNAEQDAANDQLEAGQGNEEKKAKDGKEELRATEEMLAREERKAANTDEERAVEERIVGEEMEAEEDKRIVQVLEAADKRKAAGGQKAADERRAAEGMKMDEERRVAEDVEAAEETRDVEEIEAAENGEAEEERKIADEREAEEEKRAAEEREAEEELMAGKEREAEEETSAAQGKEAVERWKAENEQDAEGERKVDKQREARGERIGETEKSAEDKRKGSESINEEEQHQDAKRSDAEEKKSSEFEHQKTTTDQKEDEGTVKLEEPTGAGKHAEDQNQEKETEEKQEEKHEASGRNHQEDRTTPSDQTRVASLAAGECDLFDGDWEYDPAGPLYTNSTCFYIRGDHNCMSNGRPDTDYLNWRWKPRGCDLPRFDARAFMQAFKGKTIGFIGDSLARNQMQSMLCMLSLVEVPIQLLDDGLTAQWLYEQHQVTLAVAWSPYLLKESQEGVMGFEKGQSVLYLDVLDQVWTSMLPHCDIILLSVGQWYFKPSVYIMQDEIIGCHYCPNFNITQIGFSQAYSEGLRRALEKVTADWKGIAVLSTFASAHGERGPGDEGDQCRRERPLAKEEWESSFRGMQNEMRAVVLGEFNRMVNDKSKLNNDVHIEFLDVSTLSLLRADGHPGAYYNAHPYEGKSPNELVFNDCLHWCLPGPVDTSNQLLVRIAHKYL